jgi:hypothetical protein
MALTTTHIRISIMTPQCGAKERSNYGPRPTTSCLRMSYVTCSRYCLGCLAQGVFRAIVPGNPSTETTRTRTIHVVADTRKICRDPVKPLPYHSCGVTRQQLLVPAEEDGIGEIIEANGCSCQFLGVVRLTCASTDCQLCLERIRLNSSQPSSHHPQYQYTTISTRNVA